MLKSIACLSLCLFFAHAGHVMGQSKLSPRSKLSPPGRSSVTPRRDFARAATKAQLIQQRAIYQAKQRRAHIQARKWLGISLLRPNLRTNRLPLIW